MCSNIILTIIQQLIYDCLASHPLQPQAYLQPGLPPPRLHSSPRHEARCVTASLAWGLCFGVNSGCAACGTVCVCGCECVGPAPGEKALLDRGPSQWRGVSVRAVWPVGVSLGTCPVCPGLRRSPCPQPWCPSGHNLSPLVPSEGSEVPRL